MALLYDPEEQRRLLALSFEPHGNGFLYYRWRWSRGVPVSAAEREAYLAIPAFGSRRAWRRRIAARETAPPRAYGPTMRKMTDFFPWSMIVTSVTFGIAALLSAWYAPSPLAKLAYGVVGCILLLPMGPIVVAKLSVARDR